MSASKRWLDVLIGLLFVAAIGLRIAMWFESTLIRPVTQPQHNVPQDSERQGWDPDAVQVLEVYKFEGSLEGTFTPAPQGIHHGDKN